MALNDIYRVRLTTAYDAAGSVMLQNVWYYEQIYEVPGATGAAQLTDYFKTVVFPDILAVLHVDAHFAGLNVENIIPGPDNVFEIYGTTDFPGSRTGSKMPPFAAWAFRYNRVSTDIRNGQKRFGPISETDQDAGVAQGTIVPLLNDLASSLGSPLGVFGSFSTYVPRIYRAPTTAKTIPAKTIPAKLQLVREVGSVGFTAVTTQNSRKFGHGT